MIVPVKHPLFSILSLLSLLACLASCAMWVQSYYIPVDEGFWPSPEGAWFDSGYFSVALDSLNGKVIAYTATTSSWNETGINAGVGDHFWSGNDPDLGGTFLGLRCGSASWAINGWSASIRAVVIPYSYIAVGSALLPGAWLRRRYQRAKRISRGCCVACGYDLRASSGRCTECGAISNTNANITSKTPVSAEGRIK
jgi:hypothetical protein